MSQWKRTLSATMDSAHYFLPKHADTEVTRWAGGKPGILADSAPHPM